VNIYVGNLWPDVTEQELRLEFSAFGEVASVIVISDRLSRRGQTAGYGYVEMVSKIAGAAAIAGLNGKRLKGLPISVIEALPLSDKKAMLSRDRKAKAPEGIRKDSRQ
jgi:RNA recognition motif-containing protein